MMAKVFQKRSVLIPYFTLGDPSIAFTKKLLYESFESGADIIELGIPFSDPLADGPVIQASHQRALIANPNIDIEAGFEVVSDIKKRIAKPILFMMAVNLLFRYGMERFFKKAHAIPLDGVILPDLSLEEAQEYLYYSKRYHTPIIFLVSPLCSAHRLRRIVKVSKGFVYLISSTGTTGERDTISKDLSKWVQTIKSIKSIPVAVGFGISKPEHLDTVYEFADGAIIGSHFVKMIGESQDPEKAIQRITHAISTFKAIPIPK